MTDLCHNFVTCTVHSLIMSY